MSHNEAMQLAFEALPVRPVDERHERIATALLAAYERGREEEREWSAGLVDLNVQMWPDESTRSYLERIRDAIRARSRT